MNEHETHAAVVAEMRGTDNKCQLATKDGTGCYHCPFGSAASNCLFNKFANRAEAAHKREIDALTAELDTAKHCWKVWSARADELVAKCDKYYAIARKLKDLTKRLCDGLNHVYERECCDYGTGAVYDEARAYLAELDKGGSAIPPPTAESEVKR